MKSPKSDQEWQQAVNLAQFALLLDATRQYGLLTGGPTINVARCETLLRRGARRGIVPLAEAIDELIEAFAAAVREK